MKKAMVKKKKRYATFMFIPEGQSNVRSFRFPIWFPRLVAGFIFLLVLASGTCFYAFSELKAQHQLSREEIGKLISINDSQKIEIEKLQKNSIEVQKQLEENSQMLEEVKKAVGITPSSTDESVPIKLAAPEESSPISLLTGDSSRDMSAKLESIESDFVSLSDKIAEQKQAISDSLGPIKDQLAYLRAKPSIVPVVASITAGFGYRKNPFTSRGSEFHKGVDFAASYGQTAVATGDGIVIFAGWNAGYGRMIIISHGYGITTLYAHNSKLLVKQGDKVKKGQPISKVGNTGRSTGTHLHYEVKVNGKNVNPSKYFN